MYALVDFRTLHETRVESFSLVDANARLNTRRRWIRYSKGTRCAVSPGSSSFALCCLVLSDVGRWPRIGRLSSVIPLPSDKAWFYLRLTKSWCYGVIHEASRIGEIWGENFGEASSRGSSRQNMNFYFHPVGSSLPENRHEWNVLNLHLLSGALEFSTLRCAMGQENFI